MGIISDSIQDTSIASTLPSEEKGVLGTVLTGITSALDAPGNATRSVLTGEYANAVKSLIPFAGSRYVSGEDVTGSDNFWLNLGVEVLADPTIFISAIGKPTKLGAALSRYETLLTKSKVLKVAGKVEEGAEIATAINKTKDELKVLGKAAQGKLTKRSILTMGLPFAEGIDLGDAKTVSKLLAASPVSLMPDLKGIYAHKKEQRLNANLLKATEETENVRELGNNAVYFKKLEKQSEIEEQLKMIQKDLTDVKPAIIPTAIATKLHALKRGIKTHFGHSYSPQLESLLEVSNTDLRRDMRVLGDRAATDKALYEETKNALGLDELVLNDRLINLAEFRDLAKTGKLPTAQDLSQETAVSIQKASQIAKEQLDATSKIVDPVQADVMKRKILAKLEDDITGFKISEVSKKRRLTKLASTINPDKKFTPEEFKLVDTLFNDSDDMVTVARQNRIGITALNEDMIDYIYHMKSPEAGVLYKKDKAKYNMLMREASVRLVNAEKRKILPGLSIAEVNDYFREAYNLDFDFFSTEPLKIINQRRVNQVKTINRAAFINNAVSLFGVETKKSKSNVSVKAFMKSMGLVTDEIEGLPKISATLRMPKKIAEELTNHNKILKDSILNESKLIGTLRVIDEEVNSWYRFGLTVPFPSFHFRNFFSNMMLNALGDVGPVLNGHRYIEAGKLQRAISKGTASTDQIKLWNELRDYGIVREQIAELGALTGKSRPEQLLGKIEQKGLKIPFKGGIDIGVALENNARIAHYLAKRSKGLTQFEAMRSVNKYLFDYSRLTATEQKIMKPTILFYSWLRNNLPLMVGSVITHPRLMATYAKITNTDEKEIPTWLKTRGTIPNPYGEGFFSDPGFPAADLRTFDVSDVPGTFFSEANRLGQKVLSKASPVLKTAYTIFTGTDPFSRKSIENIRSVPEYAEFVNEQLPTSRAFNTLSRFADTTEPWLTKLISATTGVKYYNIPKIVGKIALTERKALATGKFDLIRGHLETKRKYREQRNDEGELIREGDSEARRIQRMIRRLERELNRR